MVTKAATKTSTATAVIMTTINMADMTVTRAARVTRVTKVMRVTRVTKGGTGMGMSTVMVANMTNMTNMDMVPSMTATKVATTDIDLTMVTKYLNPH